MTGYIHSLQSMGAVDGPGIRYCIFLQGCPLRCMYCHNPDTWKVKETIGRDHGNGVSDIAENSLRIEGGKTEHFLGTPYTAEELILKIMRYKYYFSNGGGVTVSGGEPLLQAEFVTELFSLLKENRIHTCLDTSGNFPEELRDIDNSKQVYDNLLEVTDLVICDLKFTSEREYHELSGGSLKKVQFFLDMVTEHSVPLWIRHVVVPGYTDSEAEVTEMARLAHMYPTLEKIELLPFHKLCIPKYEAMGLPFRCANVPECGKETLERLEKIVDLSDISYRVGNNE